MNASQDEADDVAAALQLCSRIPSETLPPRLPPPERATAETVGAELIGRGLEPVRRILRELVKTPVPFFLLGPSGSGKDCFARALYGALGRPDMPFQVVNCAAISEPLIESEFFGCRRGAYTGAVSDAVGILEAAQGGMVLLNEITEVPLAVQAKLLQAVEEQLIWRVGESQPRRIKVWFAAASNRTDIAKLCERRLFREDLYHRLAQVEVSLPPLRERAADIPELLDYLTVRLAGEMKRRPITFEADALRAMARYGWPGNVRQLANVVTSLTLMNKGDAIGIDMIPEAMRREPSDGRATRMNRDELRRMLIEVRWNVTSAARRIGYSREYVHSLMRRYKLERPAKTRSQRHGAKQFSQPV